MNYEDLTPEQREMAKSCSTPEELLELSKKHGYELSVEELDAASGGGSWSCPGHCDGYYPAPCASGSTRPSEASSAVGYE